MKRVFTILCLFTLVLCLYGCVKSNATAKVVATTKPVYDFTQMLCSGTDITVELLIEEKVSCLHDYTLQVQQMRAIEGSEMLIISGAGLEDFLHDATVNASCVIDASQGIQFHCSEHSHSHDDGHHHESDPHIWLSIQNARQMAVNISNGLIARYPQHEKQITHNLTVINEKFDKLYAYGQAQLSQLSTRNMITFHDGFSYFAEDWDLHILQTVEEESGSEASAAELKELIMLVRQNHLPAIFVEENGSASAAQIVASETGVNIFILNMAMSDKDYFESMYQNIDAVKEAMG